MHQCKCNPECEAVVKSKSRDYARGHSPASHIFTEERCKRISKAAKRTYRNGRINPFKGKHHSTATKVVLAEYANNRTPEHVAKLNNVLANKSKEWQERITVVTRKRNKENPPHLGCHHTKETRKQIGKTRRHRIKLGKIITWNKGEKGLQVSWNKGLTKETDKRVAAGAKTLLGLYASGERIPADDIGHRRYEKGYIYSKKAKRELYYQGSWERIFIELVDSAKIGKRLVKQPFGIPYKFKEEWHTYFPDYLLELIDGRKIVVEVKGERLPNYNAKFAAAIKYCNKRGYEYVVISEKPIKPLNEYIT